MVCQVNGEAGASMATMEGNSMMSSSAPLNWYALHIRSRHEKRVAERLVSQSLETFLPLHRSRHTWKNGVHVDVDLPLFPCYLFARVSIYDRIRLLQHPGVLGFAASSARPTVIPDEEISILRTATEGLKSGAASLSEKWRRSAYRSWSAGWNDGYPHATEAGVAGRSLD